MQTPKYKHGVKFLARFFDTKMHLKKMPQVKLNKQVFSPLFSVAFVWWLLALITSLYVPDEKTDHDAYACMSLISLQHGDFFVPGGSLSAVHNASMPSMTPYHAQSNDFVMSETNDDYYVDTSMHPVDIKMHSQKMPSVRQNKQACFSLFSREHTDCDLLNMAQLIFEFEHCHEDTFVPFDRGPKISNEINA